jgi:hypothetical protein
VPFLSQQWVVSLKEAATSGWSLFVTRSISAAGDRAPRFYTRICRRRIVSLLSASAPTYIVVKAEEKQVGGRGTRARPLSIVRPSLQAASAARCLRVPCPCLDSSAGPHTADSHEPRPAAVIMSSRLRCARRKSHRRLVMCCACSHEFNRDTDGDGQRGSLLLCPFTASLR